VTAFSDAATIGGGCQYCDPDETPPTVSSSEPAAKGLTVWAVSVKVRRPNLYRVDRESDE